MNFFSKLTCLILMLNVTLPVFSFSIIPNVQAQNLARYGQYNRNRYNRQQTTVPYVYSAQQARYYGLRLPDSQYRQYGLYQQNYNQQNQYNNSSSDSDE